MKGQILKDKRVESTIVNIAWDIGPNWNILMLFKSPTRDVLRSPKNDDAPEMQASSMPKRRDLGRVGAHAAGARELLSPDSKWP